MSSPSWVPQPIDTSDVSLPEQLLSLVEALAQNAHDIWGQQRIREGWRYGPDRDDEKRTNPLLVPYAELPEEEKEVDRQLAIGTIKVILKLGHVIPEASAEPGNAA